MQKLSLMVSFMQSQESRQWGISDGISSMGTTDYYAWGGGGEIKNKNVVLA